MLLEPQMQDLFARLLVPGVLGLAGIITLVQYALTRRRHAWPSVTGEVKSVEVQSGPCPEGRRRGRPGHWPLVRVDYSVDGREYTCEQLAARHTCYRNAAEAGVICAIYRPGQQVPVWYDPQQPATGYLVPGGAVGGRFYLVLGTVLVALDVALTVWLLHLR